MSNYYLPIWLEQGADYVGPSLVLVDSSSYIPRSLVGATARLQLRVTLGDDFPLLALTETATADGQVVLGGIYGTIVVKIAKSALERLTDRAGVYALLITTADGQTIRFLSGSWIYTASATR